MSAPANVVIQAENIRGANAVKLFNRKSKMISLLVLPLVFLLAFVPHVTAFSTGQAASLVIGESSFTSFNPAATSTSLVTPIAAAFDSSGNLWVADQGANRVLEYTTPLSTHEAASLVIGQASFTTNAFATTSTGLNAPQGLAFDSSGNLWVVDALNDRVLEYTTPLSTGEAASLVIGEPNFTIADDAASRTGLSTPSGLAFDSSGNLWVADYAEGRVLQYAGSSAPTASTSTTSASSTTTASGSVSQTSTLSAASSQSQTSSATSTQSQTSSAASSQSQTSSGGGGGGVPDFPYQFVIATVFTVLLVTSYLFVRRRATPRDHTGQEALVSA